jgi:hypothetical protein
VIWGWLALVAGLFLLGGAYSFLRQKKGMPLVVLMVLMGLSAAVVGFWRLRVFDATGA